LWLLEPKPPYDHAKAVNGHDPRSLAQALSCVRARLAGDIRVGLVKEKNPGRV
jgi:hypothetical protein